MITFVVPPMIAAIGEFGMNVITGQSKISAKRAMFGLGVTTPSTFGLVAIKSKTGSALNTSRAIFFILSLYKLYIHNQ